MELQAGAVVERYLVEHVLGAGGMATVYAAKHTLLGTRHALKVLHDGRAAARLLREGQVQARLDSPHVVPVTGVVEVGGTHALVMPLVQGCSLEAVVGAEGLSQEEVAALFEQMAAGVRAAHDAGVVHRDLKPANTLLELRRGRVVVRVADFGLARGELDPRMTRSGTFLGTPAYAAPEQLAGEEVDAQADLWSLGVMLYELLTGERPFSGESLGALLDATRSGSWDASALPEAWRPVVAGLLAERGERRVLAAPVGAAALVDGCVVEVVRARVAAAAAERAAMPTEGPPVSVESRRPHHLPAERDAFVGREEDLEALGRAVAGGRLVSVLGSGGIGKTRLVLQLGRRHLADWPGGVWFCDLSEARSVLRASPTPSRRTLRRRPWGKDPVVQLGPRDRGLGESCLVILDNFEQVARARRGRPSGTGSTAPVRGAVRGHHSRGPRAARRDRRCPCLPLDPRRMRSTCS